MRFLQSASFWFTCAVTLSNTQWCLGSETALLTGRAQSVPWSSALSTYLIAGETHVSAKLQVTNSGGVSMLRG